MAAIGYLLIYAGWAAGASAIACGLWMIPGVLQSGREPFWPLGRNVVVGGSLLVGASLGLPWLRGVGRESGGVLELSGWQGLDPFSAALVACGAITLVALAVVGRSGTTVFDVGGVLVCLATCVSLVVVGNLFVRLGEPGPTTTPAFGLAAIMTLMPVIGSVLAKSSHRDPS